MKEITWGVGQSDDCDELDRVHTLSGGDTHCSAAALVASRECESKITRFYAFFKVRNMKNFNIKFQLGIIF